MTIREALDALSTKELLDAHPDEWGFSDHCPLPSSLGYTHRKYKGPLSGGRRRRGTTRVDDMVMRAVLPPSLHRPEQLIASNRLQAFVDS